MRQEGISTSGKRLRLSVLVVCCKEPQPETRVGIITSRRVGNAVKRVRVRRMLREIHRLSRPELRKGLWIVLMAQREAASSTFAELRTEWLRLGRKLSIFRPA